MPRSHHSLRAPRSFARLALFCGILLAILPAAAPAHAEEIDWKAGKLGHLAPHIGTYRYDAVLGDPAVKATLEALVGKYVDLPDAYLSVTEALRAGGFAHRAKVNIRWVPSDDCATEAGAQADWRDEIGKAHD